MALNQDWYQDLQLYDEPHGDEFFVIDTATSPPTWYHLDGTPVQAKKPEHSQVGYFKPQCIVYGRHRSSTRDPQSDW